MNHNASLKVMRQRSWLLSVVLAILVSLSLVLLFLLTQATQSWDMYEQNYGLLFALNTVLAGFLLLVIGWLGWRLWQRLREGKFGSRLLVKLAAIFALVGIVPGVVHLNEGHSAFAGLELMRRRMQTEGLSAFQALERVASQTVFTTHTPVPAGHDRFPGHLVEEHLGPLRESLGLGHEELMWA